MLIRSFAEASWNSSVITALQTSGCSGIEIIDTDFHGQSAKVRSLAEIDFRLKKVFTTPEYWLITGHEVPQPKSRIALHNKLWKSIGINLAPVEDQVAEWCVASESGPRFFGVVKKELINDVDMCKLFRLLKTTWLIAFDGITNASLLMRALALGWERSDYYCPKVLLDFAYENRTILIKHFGPFSGSNSGVIALGNAETIQQILDLKPLNFEYKNS